MTYEYDNQTFARRLLKERHWSAGPYTNENSTTKAPQMNYQKIEDEQKEAELVHATMMELENRFVYKQKVMSDILCGIIYTYEGWLAKLGATRISASPQQRALALFMTNTTEGTIFYD